MTDLDKTDTNWKAKGQAALTWLKFHPAFTIPAGCFLLGVVVGVVI